MARFRDSFAACFAVRGFRACALLFEALDSKGNVKEFFGSGFGACFAVRGFRKGCPMARFRDSFAACFAVRGFRACVLLFEALDSNMKEFFGSGFGRFRLVSRGLGLFASKATACVLLFEAFGSGVPRPDFARPKRLFLWIPKVT